MDEEDRIAEPEENEDGKEEKSISSDLIRGHINTIILRALYDGDKYGYEIIAEIERKSHGQYSLKQPSLYSALKRLEKDGYVTSYWGGSVGGGRRKYFSLTDEGKNIAEQNQTEWEYSRTVIDSLISDKDFDFSNPAPTAVNMRVLRNTTSRVPAGEDDGEEELFEDVDYDRRSEELSARNAELEQRNSELEEKSSELDRRTAELEEERRKFEEELAARRDAEAAEEEAERVSYEERLKETNDLLEAERAAHGEALRERDALLEEERAAHDNAIRERDLAIEEERKAYETALRERQEQLVRERESREQEIADREAQIREEFAEEYRKREKELRHENFLRLINTPPAVEQESGDFVNYTAPVAQEKIAEPEPQPEPPRPDLPPSDYRTVVRDLYSNAVQQPVREEPAQSRAQSLDGVDFYDLESRAARDNIRIVTTGGKLAANKEPETRSESVVHKGKAAFLSAIVVFFLCVAEGSVALGLQKRLSLPLFYPYFIWGAGLALLLVTGLLYANHVGERALRKKSLALVNSIVAYVLVLIIILIVALAIPIDFASGSARATFIAFPAVFFTGIVAFGITYYLQIRPLKE